MQRCLLTTEQNKNCIFQRLQVFLDLFKWSEQLICADDLGGHVYVSSSLSFEEFAAKQQGKKYDHAFIGTKLWNVSWVYFYWKNVPCHGSIANVHYWPTINIQPHQRKLEF